MLPGFTSPWTTLLACTYASALATCPATAAGVPGDFACQLVPPAHQLVHVPASPTGLEGNARGRGRAATGLDPTVAQRRESEPAAQLPQFRIEAQLDTGPQVGAAGAATG